MKSPRIGRAVGAALLLSVALAGCGAADPGAAAVVGDRVVSERDVDAVMNDLGNLGGQLPERSVVVMRLAESPVIMEHLRQAGFVVSDDEVRASLPPGTGTMSDVTIEALRLDQAGSRLQALNAQAQSDPQAREQLERIGQAVENAQAELQQKDQQGELTINPRYDEQRPNWLQGGGEEMDLLPQDPHGGQPPAPEGEQPPAPEGEQAPATPQG